MGNNISVNNNYTARNKQYIYKRLPKAYNIKDIEAFDTGRILETKIETNVYY